MVWKAKAGLAVLGAVALGVLGYIGRPGGPLRPNSAPISERRKWCDAKYVATNPRLMKRYGITAPAADAVVDASTPG